MLIFRAFDAAIKSGHSAGDYSLYEGRGRAKRWRNFTRIEDANASATASTDVKQATTVSKRFGYHFHRFGKVRSDSAQRVLNEFLFLDKKFDQLSRTHLFQVLGARIALFGKRGGQIGDFLFRKVGLKSNMITCLRGKPRGAEFGSSFCDGHARIGEILF